MGWWQREQNKKNAEAAQKKQAEADKKARELKQKQAAAKAESDRKTIAGAKKRQEEADKKKKRADTLKKNKASDMENVRARASNRVGVGNKPSSSSSSKPVQKSFIKKPGKK